MIVEPYSIIPDAKPEFGRLDSLEPFDRALFGRRKPSQAMQEMQRRLLVDGSQISPGSLVPNDLLRPCYREPFGSGGSGVRPKRSKSS